MPSACLNERSLPSMTLCLELRRQAFRDEGRFVRTHHLRMARDERQSVRQIASAALIQSGESLGSRVFGS